MTRCSGSSSCRHEDGLTRPRRAGKTGYRVVLDRRQVACRGPDGGGEPATRIAVRRSGILFVNPGPDFRLQADYTAVFFGDQPQVRALRVLDPALTDGGSPPAARR